MPGRSQSEAFEGLGGLRARWIGNIARTAAWMARIAVASGEAKTGGEGCPPDEGGGWASVWTGGTERHVHMQASAGGLECAVVARGVGSVRLQKNTCLGSCRAER
eukprot:6192585-Pleurochrysis_carterae.AAC.5